MVESFIVSILMIFNFIADSAEKSGEHLVVGPYNYPEIIIQKSWPAEGPAVIFESSDLGNGYSAPAVTEHMVYVTGEKDSIGYLSALDPNGNLVWRKSYGKEWTLSYRGSRAAPVVDEGIVYVCSGFGVISSFNAETGEKIWSVDMINDLKGINVIYGYAMPVLIDDDIIYCSPGGKTNNIAALNKNTGELIWKSMGVGEPSGYGPPIIIERGDLKILLIFSEFTFMGINTKDGEILWTFDLNFKGELPCNRPIYNDGLIYIVAGPGNGAVAFKLSDDGYTIKEKWRNMDFNSAFGSFVFIDNYLLGSADYKRSYVAVDIKNGKIKSSVRSGPGGCVLADRYLITYNQRGRVGLLEFENGKLRQLNEFKINSGTGEHFALPVYHNKVLYIRHGDALLSYQLDFLE